MVTGFYLWSVAARQQKQLNNERMVQHNRIKWDSSLASSKNKENYAKTTVEQRVSVMAVREMTGYWRGAELQCVMCNKTGDVRVT
jgi:hypothetical protein